MQDISIVGFRSINALCKSRKGYKEQLYINKMSPMAIDKNLLHTKSYVYKYYTVI